jgi:hypothetical protein
MDELTFTTHQSTNHLFRQPDYMVSSGEAQKILEELLLAEVPHVNNYSFYIQSDEAKLFRHCG